MSQKTALPLFHCVVEAVITLGGMRWAGSLASEQPAGALLVLVGAAVMPSLIATRVAWTTGFAAGRRAAESGRTEPGAAPDPLA